MNRLSHITNYTFGEVVENIDGLLTPIYFISNEKRKNRIMYANVSCAFDIETSSFYQNKKKKAIMYACCLGLNGKLIMFRTWNEFISCINKIVDFYDISLQRRLIIYVHNLSFEFQFFRKLFEWETVFSSEERKPIYALTKQGIEFRCSLYLTNMRLENVGEKLLNKYKVKKLVGDLDYSLIRHSKTLLSEKEKQYLYNDVLIVMNLIQEKIEKSNIADIPLTNTGYVRRDVAEACFNWKGRVYYHNYIKKMTLTKEIYEILKMAFMGGYTHANALYVDEILTNVKSKDIASSYPAVCLSEKFPSSKFFHMKKIDKKKFELFINNYCCLIKVRYKNIKSNGIDSMISYSKVLEVEDYTLDNGRIYSASSLTIFITEQDFMIYRDFYTYDDFEILDLYYSIKAYLPLPIINSIIKYYKNKTLLKGQDEEVYMFNKGMLNSIYGMMVTDILKDENLYINDEWMKFKFDVNIDERINKYNKNYYRFLFYAWGVWVTAYARRNLTSVVKQVGIDYVYSDTDSIKYLNSKNYDEAFKEYNKRIENKLKDMCTFYGIDFGDLKPNNKLIGVFEDDGNYDIFKTLGAKRYLVKIGDKYKLTCSGLDKEKGVDYLIKEYKDDKNIFNNFSNDLKIPADCTGKLTHTYIDDEISGKVVDYLGYENEYHELSFVHLENATFNLSLSNGYIEFLKGYKEFKMI